ncbi:unnamed protein product [Didymodactylos carnosus]|uniref:ABC transporter domain-containing protein n=1 Tax=Didymodactylos carnosus TaxID=1234261 RepID=A0A8S2F236_9BILA|nr:unnamed protein product [Didymodactylos carnosus]CAF4182949.1 unnamed protein product [Didymodactylos carnosus]
MTVALSAPGFSDPPSLTMSTSMFSNMNYLYTPVSGLNSRKLPNYSVEDETCAGPEKLSDTILLPSSLGSICVLRDPYMNITDMKQILSLNMFSNSCSKVYQPDMEAGSLNDISWSSALLAQQNENSTSARNFSNIPTVTSSLYYVPCHCSSHQSRFICQMFHNPPARHLITNDYILNITLESNEILYYLYTVDNYRLNRYGGLSFGLTQSFIPHNYPTKYDYNSNQHLEYSKNPYYMLQKLGSRNTAVIFTNHKGYHTLPLYINIMSNAILRANIPLSKGLPSAYGITTINHPMNETNNMLSTEFILQGSDVVISIFIIVAMSFVPASFTLFLVYERATKSKHIQYINGLYPLIYWLTNFIWDLLNYLLPAACVIVILRLFNVPAYTEGENFTAVISLFLLYGWSIIPLMYPFSFKFTEPSNAYIFLIVINLFSGITCIYTSFFLEIFDMGNSPTSMLSKITRNVKKIFRIFPNYCLGRGLIDIAYNDYYNSFYKKTGLYDKIRSPFQWEIVVSNLVSMAISGVVFWILTLLLEYEFFYSPKIPDALPISHLDEDEDVGRARKHVLKEQCIDDVLVLYNLSKTYKTRIKKNLIAVNNICLGIPASDCFGLLGVNGAGKTTTFRMLTGDLRPTAGYARVNGFDSIKERRQVFKHIGYCPQFDALFDELTPLEHMLLTARLRGILWEDEKAIATNLLQKLDLVEYYNIPVGKLSLGNKRKLSTALALVGDPTILFLDEPTSGMDPSARRFLWNVIRQLIKDGRSIILTSHSLYKRIHFYFSMEECEELCGSLAIMVNGCFRCLGSTQHLKNRFGDGYTIKIRLKQTISDDSISSSTASNDYLQLKN